MFTVSFSHSLSFFFLGAVFFLFLSLQRMCNIILLQFMLVPPFTEGAELAATARSAPNGYTRKARTAHAQRGTILILHDGYAFSFLFLCRREVQDTVFAILFRLGCRQEEQRQRSFFFLAFGREEK